MPERCTRKIYTFVSGVRLGVYVVAGVVHVW